MSQHDYVLDNAIGSNFRVDLNAVLAAIASNNSGATEPTTTYAYMWWADTTTGLLKRRNSTNASWITIMSLDSLTFASPTMTGTTQVAALTASGLTTLNGGAVVVGAFGVTNTQASTSSLTLTNASASAGAYTQVVAAGDAGSCIIGYSGSANAVAGGLYDGDFAYILSGATTAGLNIAAVTGQLRVFVGGTASANKVTETTATGFAVTGAISATTTLKTGGYTVATLPAGSAGMTAYVTDATAPTWLAALTGGGAVVCPVFHNGTAWRSA